MEGTKKFSDVLVKLKKEIDYIVKDYFAGAISSQNEQSEKARTVYISCLGIYREILDYTVNRGFCLDFKPANPGVINAKIQTGKLSYKSGFESL